MNANNSITKLVDKIIALELTKGIQPSELADAIFEKEYSEICFKNLIDKYEAIVCFNEIVDNQTSKITMKYTYDKNKYLIIIDEKINNKPSREIWNREKITQSLCNDLKLEASRLNLNLTKLLNSLPKEGKYKSSDRLIALVS